MRFYFFCIWINFIVRYDKIFFSFFVNESVAACSCFYEFFMVVFVGKVVFDCFFCYRVKSFLFFRGFEKVRVSAYVYMFFIFSIECCWYRAFIE